MNALDWKKKLLLRIEKYNRITKTSTKYDDNYSKYDKKK